MQKTDFMSTVMQIWIYNKYDVQRENFINVETNFINAEKYILLLWNSNMKKHSDLAFKFRKHDFTRCFMRKQLTIFWNSEQKIIYAKEKANNFLNNAEQKIPMLKTVYAKNNEQFLWENSEQFYLIQKTNFINAVSRFEYTVNMMCREQILLT